MAYKSIISSVGLAVVAATAPQTASAQDFPDPVAYARTLTVLDSMKLGERTTLNTIHGELICFMHPENLSCRWGTGNSTSNSPLPDPTRYSRLVPALAGDLPQNFPTRADTPHGRLMCIGNGPGKPPSCSWEQ